MRGPIMWLFLLSAIFAGAKRLLFAQGGIATTIGKVWDTISGDCAGVAELRVFLSRDPLVLFSCSQALCGRPWHPDRTQPLDAVAGVAVEAVEAFAEFAEDAGRHRRPSCGVRARRSMISTRV